MKQILLLLMCCILMHFTSFSQTCNATVTADGPTTFCLGDSVQLTANTGGNFWMSRANFSGIGRLGAATFSIGIIGYLGTGQDVSGNRLNDFWSYNSITNTWTQLADFAGTARTNAVGLSVGSKGYVGTGSDGSNKRDFWEYDPTSNTWTQKADFGGSFRTNAVGFTIDDKCYIGTGRSGTRNKDFWEYNPSTDVWTRKADFPGTEREAGTGFSVDGKGYIGLGFDINLTFKSDFYEYNPTNDTWTQKADFPGSPRMQTIGFGIQKFGFVGLGITRNIRYNDLWEFNPETNTWIQKADFPGGVRRLAAAFSINGLAYVGLGQDQRGGLKNEFWSYQPSHRYLWSTGDKTRSIFAKVTGDYSVTLSSSTGCTSTSAATSVLAKPLAALGGISASANPICPGTTTDLTATGIDGYNAQVKWYSGSAGSGMLLGTGNSLNGVGAGKYYVLVTADCGIPQEDSITIIEYENAGLQGISAAANPICGLSTTSITAYGVTGTNAVLNWYDAPNGGGNNLGSGTILNNVTKGTYYARVTASCGAPAETSIIIDTFMVARFDTSVTICNSYRWHDSTYKVSGDYYYTTTSYMGCDSIETLHLTIWSVTSTYTKSDEACLADSSGSLTITPTNGKWPYLYRLGTVNSFVSDSVFTKLREGKYRVTIQDADGCFGISDQITIQLTTSISATSSTTDISCNGAATGSLTVTPTSGRAPFEYKLGNSGNFVTTGTFTNLKAGSYRVFIKDANGCTGRTGNIIVNQAAPITGNIIKVNPSCNNTYTGSISITPTNGIAPYLYRLGTTGNFISNNVFTNLRSGNYRLFIMDNTNCVGSLPVTLSQPTKVTLTASHTDVSCIGDKDGTITANASGGTPPYMYKFGTAGTFGTSNIFNNLKAGSYRIFVIDANNCVGNSIIETVGELPTACSRQIPFVNSLKQRSKDVTTMNFDVVLLSNPVQNNFNIVVKSSDVQSVEYKLVDINGRIATQGKTMPQQNTIFGSELNSGIYLLEVTQGNNKKTIKVVKM